MPNFNPSDYDPDAKAFVPPAAGDYQFAVTEASNETSKAGNPMIALKLLFDIGRQDDLTVYERLVFVPAATWVIHDFCAATGLDFSSGNLDPEDCLGRTGTAQLVLGKPNSKGKRYMEVEKFLPSEGYTEQPTSPQDANAAMDEQAEPDGDDGIPF